MSPFIPFRLIPLLTFLLLIAAGCATPLPPAYFMPEKGPELPGSVSAIALENGQVAVANPEGVFIKGSGGEWERQQIPGLRNPDKVTCMDFFEGRLYVGSDGEGLHVLSAGKWEAVNELNSGVLGDRVLSMAVDGESDGLPGTALWVTTHQGVASLKDGAWLTYVPEDKWLNSLFVKREKEVYRSSRYDLVRSQSVPELFKPPVTVVAVGSDRLFFANRTSRLAVVGSDAMAIVHFLDGRNVISLTTKEDVVWAGTDAGLLWGGIAEKADGRPWPTNHPQVSWKGSLSGSRDTRPFDYRWFQLGYNVSNVVDLAREGRNLWVAYAGGDGWDLGNRSMGSATTSEDRLDSIVDLRRYLNIYEYVLRSEKPFYESYGKDDGLSGEFMKVEPGPGEKEVWVGTKKGLYRLEK